MTPYLDFVSGVLAGALSLVFLKTSHRRLPARASMPILGRFLVDGLAAYLAFSAIGASYSSLSVIHQPVIQVLLAVFGGAGFLRVQLQSAEKKGGKLLQNLSPATYFLKFTDIINESIDRESASSQANWMEEQVSPMVSQYTLDELSDKVRNYIANRTLLDEPAKNKQIKFILGVVESANGQNDQTAKLTIMQRLIDSGGEKYVRNLVRQQKRKVNSDSN